MQIHSPDTHSVPQSCSLQRPVLAHMRTVFGVSNLDLSCCPIGQQHCSAHAEHTSDFRDACPFLCSSSVYVCRCCLQRCTASNPNHIAAHRYCNSMACLLQCALAQSLHRECRIVGAVCQVDSAQATSPVSPVVGPRTHLTALSSHEIAMPWMTPKSRYCMPAAESKRFSTVQ